MKQPRRTTPALVLASLIGTGLVGGRLIPELILRSNGDVPRVSWAAALALVLGAGIVGWLAWTTWNSLHKQKRRMTSDHAVTMLALAKASSLVGALFAGGYAGFAAAYIGSADSPLGKERFLHAGGAAIAGLLLMIAGLLLERACRLPGGDDEATDGKTVPGATPA